MGEAPQSDLAMVPYSADLTVLQEMFSKLVEQVGQQQLFLDLVQRERNRTFEDSNLLNLELERCCFTSDLVSCAVSHLILSHVLHRRLMSERSALMRHVDDLKLENNQLNESFNKNNYVWVQTIETLESQLQWAMGELNVTPGMTPGPATPLPPYDPSLPSLEIDHRGSPLIRMPLPMLGTPIPLIHQSPDLRKPMVLSPVSSKVPLRQIENIAFLESRMMDSKRSSYGLDQSF